MESFMADAAAQDYLIVVQCDIVMERCSGYYCERAVHHRTGGLAIYPQERALRTIYLTCGGCCGRALQRKLMNVVTQAKKREGIERERMVVHLATCITQESHHGPRCPFLDYLQKLVARTGLTCRFDTHVSERSAELREAGVYEASVKPREGGKA